jgi:hypothetical protein
MACSVLTTAYAGVQSMPLRALQRPNSTHLRPQPRWRPWLPRDHGVTRLPVAAFNCDDNSPGASYPASLLDT